jgi:tetratricopeptide (TPR) repeat protein
MGNQGEALKIIREVVDRYRALATRNPDAFGAELATSLNNLSEHLGDIGEHDAALDAAHEAVAHYRKLALGRAEFPGLDASATPPHAATPLGARPDGLANGHSSTLIKVTSTIKNVAVSGRPDGYQHQLAKSLIHLSQRCSARGAHDEALAAIDEALALYRELTRWAPDTFWLELVTSLNILAGRACEFGRPRDGLAAALEAVGVCRGQVARNRTVCEPELARSLHGVTDCHRALGDPGAALATAHEAVALYRRLAHCKANAYEPELARSLTSLSRSQADAGDPAGAVTTAHEVVALYRALAARAPGVFAADLTASLRALGIQMHGLCAVS